MNKVILLSYTEIPKDRIQNVFHVDATKKPTQTLGRDPQLLRRQLLALADHFNTALK